MRNLAMSSNASFDTVALRWSKSDLPITLRWRSTLWRFIVPPLWALGWAFWIWVLSVETGESTGLYALLFVSIPLLLAASAAWWVGQLLHKRHAGTIVINDDYVEWEFEMGSTVEMLAECGQFELHGKHNLDARIEWEMNSGDHAGESGWARLVRKWTRADCTLYARDLGLDRTDLDSLCKLLNELRDEAKARR
jgi:hypothetical protein